MGREGEDDEKAGGWTGREKGEPFTNTETGEL